MSQEQGLVKRDGVSTSLLTHDDLIAVFWEPARLLEAMAPRYLPLPEVLGALASHSLYLAARPFGRLQYREDMYEVDATGASLEYGPVKYSRAEVIEAVNELLRPTDARVALLPLPWRVGWLVGWLSGLAVAQRDEAQAGMVLLAMLVTPLLVSTERKQQGKCGRKTTRLNAGI